MGACPEDCRCDTVAPEKKHGHTTWERQGRHCRGDPVAGREGGCEAPLSVTVNLPLLLCALVRLDKGPVFKEEVREEGRVTRPKEGA